LDLGRGRGSEEEGRKGKKKGGGKGGEGDRRGMEKKG